MKNVNLQQLFYFKIAMKCSSFSQAAEIAYTTQSTISKNISSLEEDHRRTSFYTAEEGNTAYTESHYSEFGTGGVL